MYEYLFKIPFFICWGSFLNVLAVRLISSESILTRSRCPHCSAPIAWYDNIPLISWIALGARCRSCKHTISWLYPFIELLTPLMMTALSLIMPADYFWAYFIFFSALIVTIRSDLETMLISRLATLGIVPIGIAASFLDWTPVYPLNSIAGALIGYGVLWLTAATFKHLTGKDGLGEGDFDLLACIGAFTGIMGVWATITIGSLLGSLIGITWMYLSGRLGQNVKIPFGPFLAAGAILFVLFYDSITLFIMGY